MAFFVWLLSLSIMFLRFIHVVTCTSTSFHLWLHNILLYGGITICLSVHLLMGNWVVSTFWLLWTMLLLTLTYKLLCQNMFPVLLGISLGMELAGYVVTFWLFQELLFSTMVAHFTFPPALYDGFSFSISSPTPIISPFKS